jgi:hypothetical protein
MAWTYDPTDLTTDTPTGRLNVVRYLVGDTDNSSPQVQDEEINFSLSQSSDNVYSAASNVAMAIASKYSKLVTTELDGQLLMEYTDLAKAYKNLASDLKRQGQSVGSRLGVSAGGLGVESTFERHQFDNKVQRPKGDWLC